MDTTAQRVLTVLDALSQHNRVLVRVLVSTVTAVTLLVPELATYALLGVLVDNCKGRSTVPGEIATTTIAMELGVVFRFPVQLVAQLHSVELDNNALGNLCVATLFAMLPALPVWGTTVTATPLRGVKIGGVSVGDSVAVVMVLA